MEARSSGQQFNQRKLGKTSGSTALHRDPVKTRMASLRDLSHVVITCKSLGKILPCNLDSGHLS